MANKQFPYYIEDWILWIGNRVDNHGNEIDFPYYRTAPLKLANYDVSFVNRSAEAIKEGQGFTERQLGTAVKIITKYRRQILSKISVDPEYLKQETPQKLETREVDRSFSIRKQQDLYEVRFPYNPAMVDAMHKLSARSTGDYAWQSEQRAWHVGLTEANLVLLRDFVTTHKSHSWNMDKATLSDFAIVDAALEDPLAHVPHIDLDVNDKPAVFNANSSLKAALSDFDWSQDPANIVFRADNYGLRVGPQLTNHVKTHYYDIHKALLTSQAEIYANSKNLDCCLRVNNLEQFMQTVRADYWAFVSFKYGKGLGAMAEAAIGIDAPGEKLFYNDTGVNKFDFLKELAALDTKKMVIFTDNAMLMGRAAPTLLSKPLLRIIYLYGQDTGLIF
jgi:hypothetical protein